MNRSYDFVANTADDLHCLQAAVSMLSGALGKRSPSPEELEEATNFRAGHLTWPFGAWLYLAEEGLDVTVVERFDYSKFLANPRQELLAQSGDPKQVDEVLDGTDFDLETPTLEACLSHPRIHFEDRIPDLDDLRATLSKGGLVLCNINVRALNGKDGWYGHFVIVDAVEEESLRIQDPGLPPRPDYWVTSEDFDRAWRSPQAEMANALIVSNPSAS